MDDDALVADIAEIVLSLSAKPHLIDEIMPVRVHDGLVLDKEIEELNAFIKNNGFNFGWTSHKNVEFSHWNRNLTKHGVKNRKNIHSFLPKELLKTIERIASFAFPSGSEIIRAYFNGYTYGTDGYVHTDSDFSEDKTCVVYLNKEWRPDWAGETVFFDEDNEIIRSVLPKRGRAVVFPSNMLHAARSVSRICPVLRTVFVLKVKTNA